MGLRRLMVVGCGGSGVSTLCFMLDHVRSTIGGADLPAGWQFAAIDVPLTPQSGPMGLPDVRRLGAKYLPTGIAGGYGQIDRAVMGMAEAVPNVLPWAPPADGWGVSVSDGAGQYRAVGRMLTLAKLRSIREGLERSWQTLSASDTHAEMADLAARMDVEYDRDSPPLVLVVSSMAGGAGASMALDVCRTLGGINGVDPNLIAVFMVGSDVFQGLPASARTGVFANSLAMLGEIVACQNGAAASPDEKLWAALGQGRPSRVPFGRVFPIGRLAGLSRAPFGEATPAAIYRGLGRALGGLACSSAAMEQFVQFDLTNKPPLPLDLDWSGWGGSADEVVWGSLGFASLSMGRDRYAEYAAQRLARGAADRLIAGHRREDPTRVPDTEQLNELVRSQFPQVLGSLGLWDGTGRPIEWFMETAWPRQELNRSASEAMTALSGVLPPPEAQDGSAWAGLVRRRIADQSARLQRASGDAVYAWAFDYSRRLHESILAAITDAITRFGLSYARALSDAIADHLRMMAPRLRELEAQYGDAPLDRLDSNIEGALSVVNRVLRNGQALLDSVVENVRKSFSVRTRGQGCGYLATVLEQTCWAVLEPMSRRLGEAWKDLSAATQNRERAAGLAMVATERYAEWPAESDHRVPSRFGNATSEVLLTPPEEFIDDFARDVQAAFPGHSTYAVALEQVVSAVVSGVWESSGEPSPGGLLVLRVPPHLKTFPTLPGADAKAVPPTPRTGDYAFEVSPSSLLERARRFVSRPGESFAIFCGESLRSYVVAKGLPEHERDSREAAVLLGFRKVLDLALPLATPNAEIVSQLHGVEVRYRFKFSEMPFASLPISELVRRQLAEDQRIEHVPVEENLDRALSESATTQRIDVFGSYPNYAYLCFDSVLEPAAKEWNLLQAYGAEAFWAGRRTRPLPGSLPFSDLERRSLVAAWLLGQITGHLRIGRGLDGVINSAEVFDEADGVWRSFPRKLLTGRAHLVHHPEDAMAAVLEGALVATAEVSQGSLEPLTPYRVLRRVFNSEAPDWPLAALSGGRLLAEWARTGEPPAGGKSAVPQVSPQARLEGARKILTAYRSNLVPDRESLQRRDWSLRWDLAEDIEWALDQLEALLDLVAKPVADGEVLL